MRIETHRSRTSSWPSPRTNNAHEAQPFTGAELVLLDGRLAAWCSVRLCARCAYQMHVREKRFTHTQYEHMEACVMSDSAEWHYERL